MMFAIILLSLGFGVLWLLSWSSWFFPFSARFGRFGSIKTLHMLRTKAAGQFASEVQTICPLQDMCIFTWNTQTHTHTYTCVHIHMCIHICIWTHTHTYIYIYINIYSIYIYICIYTNMYIHMYVCVCMCHLSIYIYVYASWYMYTRMNIMQH